MNLMPIRNPFAVLTLLFAAVKTVVALACIASDDKAVSNQGGVAFTGGIIFITAALLFVRAKNTEAVWIRPGSYSLLRIFLMLDLLMTSMDLAQTYSTTALQVFIATVSCDVLALALMGAGRKEMSYPRGL